VEKRIFLVVMASLLSSSLGEQRGQSTELRHWNK
jgi:hypothetical protein